MAGDIDSHHLSLVQEVLQQDDMGNISFQQFVNILATPDNQPKTCFQKSVHRVAKEVLTEKSDRKIYSDYYSCFPPPLLMIILSLVQLGFYVYYAATWDRSTPVGWLSGPVPVNSPFIYSPARREQIFRFFTYIVLHAGVEHLVFNLAVQLLLGVPLEMIHGTFRVGAVYLAGALAGSMSTSVIDRTVYLVGGSGGVYALLAGHLANVLTNYTEMQETFGIAKIGLILIITSADVGFSIWRRYNDHPKDTRVSFLAHLFGLLAGGLAVGLLILRNFEQKLHERVMWWVSLVLYTTEKGTLEFPYNLLEGLVEHVAEPCLSVLLDEARLQIRVDYAAWFWIKYNAWFWISLIIRFKVAASPTSSCPHLWGEATKVADGRIAVPVRSPSSGYNRMFQNRAYCSRDLPVCSEAVCGGRQPLPEHHVTGGRGAVVVPAAPARPPGRSVGSVIEFGTPRVSSSHHDCPASVLRKFEETGPQSIVVELIHLPSWKTDRGT
ncbi:Rhomboid- protein 3 [Branchiostoma belcheri]|nr:Rhomboid- protein 3 [Branchiostoma belcheri]